MATSELISGLPTAASLRLRPAIEGGRYPTPLDGFDDTKRFPAEIV